MKQEHSRGETLKEDFFFFFSFEKLIELWFNLWNLSVVKSSHQTARD